jgi:hypothetical protein
VIVFLALFSHSAKIIISEQTNGTRTREVNGLYPSDAIRRLHAVSPPKKNASKCSVRVASFSFRSRSNCVFRNLPRKCMWLLRRGLDCADASENPERLLSGALRAPLANFIAHARGGSSRSWKRWVRARFCVAPYSYSGNRARAQAQRDRVAVGQGGSAVARRRRTRADGQNRVVKL